MTVRRDAPSAPRDADHVREPPQAFLLRLADALRPIGDPTEAQAVAARLVSERLGVARVFYADLDDDRITLPGEASDGGSRHPVRVRPAPFGAWLLGSLRRGETVVAEDVASDPRLTDGDRAAYRARGVAAFVAVPLKKDGRPAAAFVPESAEPRRWTGSDVALAREAAERTWAAVERARAEDAMRRNEARLRLALDATGLGTFVWHPADDRAEPDPRMRELLDLPPGDPLSLAAALERRVHPDDRATYAAAVARALDPAGPRRLDEEVRIVRPDGTVRWIAISGHVDGSGDGNVSGVGSSTPAMFGTVADVTERRRSQDVRRTNEERQAFLLELSDTLGSLTDPVAIATAASRLLAEQLQTGLVVEGEVIDGVVLVHGGHATSGEPLEGRFPLAAFGQPVVHAYQRGEGLVIDDVRAAADGGPASTPLLDAHGMAGMILVTLPRTATWGALLIASSTGPRHWLDAEVELVRDVARRTWAAMDALRGEAALRESEARLRTLVENITDYAIYRTNAHGIITDWTEGATRVKGYAAHEVIGRHVSMFHTPEDVANGAVERVLQEAARTGRSEHETWKVRAGGERFWANEITSSLRDATGRLVGFTRISRDLTVQRRIETDREEQLEQERTRREAAEAFMAVMSHELKTPVTSIYSAASLLRKAPGRPDLTELVDDIEDEADRLLRIVDDLLVLSGVERGLILLAPEPILIHHALGDVISTVERRFPDVVFDVERTGLMPIVLADPTALRQVATNLLTNAAKYAGSDGPVRVETTESDGAVVVSVLDRGPGLGPDPDALFTLFHRAPHTAKRASGTGIGLYVARQLAEAMGGRMGAEAREGGGSCFWFALPVAPVDENG